MALKLRKDVKKSSYYVWFLGAKESKGLRGSEYVLPVIKHLEQREKDVEPFKVTLQVSHKGLKIVQNVLAHQQPPNKGHAKPKSETIKHFIPHNTITCVYQHDDVIACILLLFNPVTKCPLHVHAYRCDSLETATLLKQQLQTLIERPDNQKKFAEIESRLKPPPQPVKTKVESSLGSDTGTSTRESESSEERFVVENSRVTTLYDSVAAELREKLNKNKVPILLPPRDYDTVHRQKGNLTGIELRRCLNANIVGHNVKTANNGNSGRRIESSGGSSGIGSDHPPSPDSPDAPDSRFNTLDNHSTTDDEDWNGDPAESTIYMMHSPPQVTLPRPVREKSPDSRYSRNSDRNKRELARFLERTTMAKYDKYEKSLEAERGRSVDRKETRRAEKPVKYFDDDGFDENIRYRNKSDFDRPSMRRSYEDDDFFETPTNNYREPPVPKTRQKYSDTRREAPSFERFDRRNDRRREPPSYDRNDTYFDQSPRKSYDLRQRTPSPKVMTEDTKTNSPRDRFKDAKEKFLSMEKEEGRRSGQSEAPISPTITKDKASYLKRHESMVMTSYERDRDRPKPAPRSLVPEEVRYRHDRYRAPPSDKYDPKRRSMFSLIEEEHRKNSNEIARELKRRSYMDADDVTIDARMANYSRSTIDLAVDQSAKKSPGYRHSYAEPKLRLEQNNKNNKHHYSSELATLHRNNSVSNGNGRVGIASVHPY